MLQLKFTDINYSPAFKVWERHSTLVLNIGTFAEEDEAYELLNHLSMSFPFFVIVVWILDSLLAVVYLKWLHPWKIIVQEVSSSWFQFRLFNPLPIRNQTSGSQRQMRNRGQGETSRWSLDKLIKEKF